MCMLNLYGDKRWQRCEEKGKTKSNLGSFTAQSSGFSRPVRKPFQRTGNALTYSPFINTRPSEFTLITRPLTCQAFRSDFKSIWGRLILKRLCWTETTLLLRKHRLHSSQCNYRDRHFPAAGRWTYRRVIRRPGTTFCPVPRTGQALQWRLSDVLCFPSDDASDLEWDIQRRSMDEHFSTVMFDCPA